MSTSTAIHSDVSRTTNPFSTRWMRPGALTYQFELDVNAVMLVARLRENSWWGAIVGPHGSGKSALLVTLAPVLKNTGRGVRSITLHDGQRRLPGDFAWPNCDEPQGLIVVDGYEQLGWIAQWKLNRHCRRSGWGLLVTVHSDAAAAGFPVLYRTSPNLATVERLIEEHLPPHEGLIQSEDVAAAFGAHQGNVRETFFALYDLFEQRRSASIC